MSGQRAPLRGHEPQCFTASHATAEERRLLTSGLPVLRPQRRGPAFAIRGRIRTDGPGPLRSLCTYPPTTPPRSAPLTFSISDVTVHDRTARHVAHCRYNKRPAHRVTGNAAHVSWKDTKKPGLRKVHSTAGRVAGHPCHLNTVRAAIVQTAHSAGGGTVEKRA